MSASAGCAEPVQLGGAGPGGKMKFVMRAKKALIRLGVRPPWHVRALLDFLEFAAWLKQQGQVAAFATREEYYAHLAGFLGQQPVDFLEFGVYRGDTMRQWLGLNGHPQSRFWGFDSFSGFPQDWRTLARTVPRAEFDTRGAIPDIRDERVKFVKGFFQQSLPPFLDAFSPRNRLILHLDADMYTSTLYVLAKMDKYLAPGSLLLFDEFSTGIDEYRAFRDYSDAFCRSPKLIAMAGETREHVAFELAK